MSDFATSTHKERWLLSREELARRREEANRRAAESLQKYGSTKVEIQADGKAASTDPQAAMQPGSMEKILPAALTVEEETLLRRHFEVKILQVCNAFGFPIKVKATAMTYFKRFYLQWSVMEHLPKDIMLTCIYLACKVEEVYVSADNFGKGINQSPEVVLDNELLALQTLKFDLVVYAPYRALRGFFYDIQSFLTEGGEGGQLLAQELQSFQEAAQLAADDIMLTDAPHCYPPGQLALAALANANEDIKLDFPRYLESVVKKTGSLHGTELHESVREICQLAKSAGQAPREEEVKPIDRKLKYCRDPSLLLHDEQKKRERKERHKLKKSLNEGRQTAQPQDATSAPALEEPPDHVAKRRKSADVIMGPRT